MPLRQTPPEKPEASVPQAESASEGGPTGFHLGYQRALDGVRGLSILAVVGLHAKLIGGRAGAVGVDVFFVLSGFLITSWLMEEWDQSRTISLQKFYLRRALRLLPALVVVLVVIVGYYWIFVSRATGIFMARDAIIAIFYCSNWAKVVDVQRPGIFGHTWSLSIEEQFYLAWPLILLFMLRRTVSRGSLLRWVVLGIFLSEMARIVLLAGGGNWDRIYFGTDTRADSLLMGCAAAVILSSEMLPKRSWTASAIKAFGYIGAAGLVFLSVRDQAGLDMESSVVLFLMSLFAALLIVHIVASQTGVLHNVLSAAPLVFVGKISYGLYLWHFVVFIIIQSFRWPRGRELAVEFPIAVTATLASFYLLERPLLRLKRQFQPVISGPKK